jgi:MYXO-CTERM domain-containing protein
MDEGHYSIVPTSTTVHSAFAPSFHDHTTGSGNFMLLNGYDQPGGADPAFFIIDLSSLTPGGSYNFSFYAANAYGGYAPWSLPANPADLGVKLVGAGAYIDTFQLASSVGNWTRYNITFTAPQSGGQLGVYDLNRQLWGNDFAFDDASLTSNAPEPATWFFAAGGMALLLFLRRRRRA